MILCGARSRWVCLGRRHLCARWYCIGEESMSEAGYSFLGLVRVPPERQHKAEPPFYWFAGPGCGRLSLRLTRQSFCSCIGGRPRAWRPTQSPLRASCWLDSPPAQPKKARSRWTLLIYSTSVALSHPYHHRSFRCFVQCFRLHLVPAFHSFKAHDHAP